MITRKNNFDSLLRKWISLFEMMISAVISIIIIIASFVVYHKTHSIIKWAQIANLIEGNALAQIPGDEIQSFVAAGKSVTVWAISKGTLSGTDLTINYDKSDTGDHNDTLDDAVNASDPILVIDTNKSPLEIKSDTDTTGTVAFTIWDSTDNLESIALHNAKNKNALEIKEVSIASTAKLAPNETLGWTLKPVGTMTFNEKADGAHNYDYRYAIGE